MSDDVGGDPLRRDRKNGRFQKGKIGGPGRPKGSRNKLGEAFIEALYDDFCAEGAAAIRHCRIEDPAGYVRVIAGILPKELEIKRPLADITDDELARLIDILRSEIEPADQPTGGDVVAAGGKPPRDVSTLQ